MEYTLAPRLSHIFRQHPSLEPHHGVSRQGLATTDDSRFLRFRWEVIPDMGWVPLAKGGLFSRFYADIETVIDWMENGRRLKALIIAREGSETKRIYSQDWYFKEGLTYLHRSMRGFCIRYMPPGCIFSTIGKAVIPATNSDPFYLLGVLASEFGEAVLRLFSAFSTFQAGMVGSIPIPTWSNRNSEVYKKIRELAKSIHDMKATWDEGNETSTRFRSPWLLRDDLADANTSLVERLDRIADYEVAEEARIRKLYAELNDEVYKLYDIPGHTRAIIEETLGDRPPEVLWPQMEGMNVEQKRMEHVLRLLSYVVKRVLDADEDGIVPFASVAGEVSVADRVHHELQTLFPKHDVGQIEVQIANELKKIVKGYRRTNSIAEWLEKVFFAYHVDLYKNRPVIWHLASSQGTAPFAFGALVHYHRFDRNRMAKLRSHYLRDAIETFRREAALADKVGNAEARIEWQARLEEALDFDRRLQWVQEGHHEGAEGGARDYRILTPWKSPKDRPKGWDPDLDDGVQMNIEPLYKAGVLRIDA